MGLFDPDGVTQVAYDNNSGVGQNPYFEFTATKTGDYFIEMRSAALEGAEYSVWVTGFSPLTNVFAEEPGNQTASIGDALVVGGSVINLGVPGGTIGIGALGEQGNDTLNGNANNNLLAGGLGNDKLYGFDGTDILWGDAGLDELHGGDGADELRGGDGEDILSGGLGADTLSGGAGKDRATHQDATAGVVALLLSAAGNAGEAKGDKFISIENLTGSKFADVLKGTNSINSLIGGDGDDTVVGFGGDDHLFGQNGNDTLNGGVGADHFSGGLGTDRVTYQDASAGVVIALLSPAANTGEAAGDRFASIESITGSKFDDTLAGNSAINTLIGGGGNDTILGLKGDDILFGQEGDDILNGGTGPDGLFGGNNLDTASYSTALAGVVASLTRPAANSGDAAGDTYASIENLTGSRFGDTLTGNSLVNALLGGDGEDTLNGRLGNDVMSGSSGKDTFVFDTALSATGNVDSVTDFRAADDTVCLENAVFTTLTAKGTLALDAFRANTTGLATDSSDRIIYETDTGELYYDANGSAAGGGIVFAELTVGLSLTSADFVVV
ncbi:calcium-binding protein [Mesorhizobium sp. ASY16-5R]|uniref:calcium-binding protein n=1 Tax=Mesorhizobium sp. ASY16-5R TaxID=3445772 RepID=UPI003FA058D2